MKNAFTSFSIPKIRLRNWITKRILNEKEKEEAEEENFSYNIFTTYQHYLCHLINNASILD